MGRGVENTHFCPGAAVVTVGDCCLVLHQVGVCGHSNVTLVEQ